MEAPTLGFVIVGIALIIAVMYQILTLFLIDTEKQRRYMLEINKWRQRYIQARKTGNPTLLKKVQKESKRIQLIQQELSKETMKMFLATSVILIIFMIPCRKSIIPIPLNLSNSKMSDPKHESIKLFRISTQKFP